MGGFYYALSPAMRDNRVGPLACCNNAYLFAQLFGEPVQNSVHHGGGAVNQTRLHTVDGVFSDNRRRCGGAYIGKLCGRARKRALPRHDAGGDKSAQIFTLAAENSENAGGGKLNGYAGKGVASESGNSRGGYISSQLRRVIKAYFQACLESGTHYNGFKSGELLGAEGKNSRNFRDNRGDYYTFNGIGFNIFGFKEHFKKNGVLVGGSQFIC